MLRAANPGIGTALSGIGNQRPRGGVISPAGRIFMEEKEEMSYQLLNPWSVLGTLPALCPTYSRHSVNKGMGG